jgi:glycosyltransferase
MKISVVTATYNAAGTVADALASVAAQTHPDVEHWVIDGGSRDGTQAVVQRHAARLAGFVSEPDGGIYDALNKGIRRATGEAIGFLHADDVYAHAGVLARVAEAFADPTVDAVYGDLTHVAKADLGRVSRYWQAGEARRARFARGWMPPHPTLYVRRRVYETLGAFDTRYRIAADYDSVVRLLYVGGVRARYIPEVLVCMRVGGASNRSLANIARKSMEDLRIMRTHGVGGIGSLLLKNVGKLGQFWQR